MAGTTHRYLDARSGPVVSRSIYSILLAVNAAGTKVQPLLNHFNTPYQSHGSGQYSSTLVIVWIIWWRSVVEEMIGAQRGVNGVKNERSLTEVEAV